MNIVFLPSTRKGLRWFRQYYMSVFAEGKMNADKQFLAMKRVLVTTPDAGRPIVGTDCRISGVPRTPFSVIYRLVDDRVEVMYVYDQRAKSAPELT